MASITKNESALVSYRTLSSSSQLVIQVSVDYTSPIPIRTVGGSNSVSIAAPLQRGGNNSINTLQTIVENAN